MAKKQKTVDDQTGKRKPSRGDRYPYDRTYCAKVEKLGADGLCAFVRPLITGGFVYELGPRSRQLEAVHGQGEGTVGSAYRR